MTVFIVFLMASVLRVCEGSLFVSMYSVVDSQKILACNLLVGFIVSGRNQNCQLKKTIVPFGVLKCVT